MRSLQGRKNPCNFLNQKTNPPMTKYIYIFLLLIFSGCKEKVKYPRIVKNGCGLYAVQIDSGITWGDVSYLEGGGVINFYPNDTSWHIDIDYSDLTPQIGFRYSFAAWKKMIQDSLKNIRYYWKTNVGNEATFPDSLSAVVALKEFRRIHHFEDSALAYITTLEKRYNDSANNCHTYK